MALIKEILDKLPKQTKEIVKRTRNDHRDAVKAALLSECRLSLPLIDERMMAVPIHVETGYPSILMDEDFDISKDQFALLEILQFLSPFGELISRTPENMQKLKNISHFLAGRGHPDFQAVRNAEVFGEIAVWAEEINGALENNQQFIKKILEKSWQREDDNTGKNIFAVHDILGAYFCQPRVTFPYHFQDEEIPVPNAAKIELYWGIIGLTSLFTGIPIEELTIVVMTHELAHAYTQIGTDIDGKWWNIDDFRETDVEVVEGLAQYFTHCALKRLGSKYEGASVAFEELAGLTGGPYTVHNDWLAKKFTPEMIRLAMLEFRRMASHNRRDYDTFKSLLKHAKEGLDPSWSTDDSPGKPATDASSHREDSQNPEDPTLPDHEESTSSEFPDHQDREIETISYDSRDSDYDYRDDEEDDDEEEESLHLFPFSLSERPLINRLKHHLRHRWENSDAEIDGDLDPLLYALDRLPYATPGIEVCLNLYNDSASNSTYLMLELDSSEFRLSIGGLEYTPGIGSDSYVNTVFQVERWGRCPIDNDGFVLWLARLPGLSKISVDCYSNVDFSAKTPDDGWIHIIYER